MNDHEYLKEWAVKTVYQISYLESILDRLKGDREAFERLMALSDKVQVFPGQILEAIGK